MNLIDNKITLNLKLFKKKETKSSDLLKKKLLPSLKHFHLFPTFLFDELFKVFID